jgi:site-specific recombinase XerD
MKTNYSISRAPSGIFYLWYYDFRGKRQKISTACRTKAEAKEFAIRFMRGEVATKANRNVRTVSEFKEEYLNHSKANQKYKTYLDKKSCLNEFLKWLRNDSLPLGGVNVKMVQDFIDYKQTTTSRATARRIYTGICAAFHSAQMWGYIEINPWRSVKKPKLVERHPLWMTADEFRELDVTLLDSEVSSFADEVDLLHSLEKTDGVIPPRRPTMSRRRLEVIENKLTLHEIIIVAFNTGLRSGELRNLTFGAINIPDRQLMVRNTKSFTTKGEKERPIPMSRMCLKVFIERSRRMKTPDDLVFPLLLNGEKRLMSESYLSHEFKKAVVRAHLNPALRFHDLRHSFASLLVKSGTPLYHVAKLLGHRDAKTTEIYAHLAASDLKDTVNVLDVWNTPDEHTSN